MALSLLTIFEETKKKYKLELICGEDGLNNIMKWVYISEDIATSAFLQSGELIITTGVSSHQSESWLYDFIYALIQQNTCGLILNTGTYIREEDITEEIRALCRHFHYPLFTMPWETRIYDITHDYYNRIFNDTQTEKTITAAFLSLIHRTADPAQSEAILAGYGYPAGRSYCVCYMQYSIPEASTLTEETATNRILFALERYLKNRHPGFHLCQNQHLFFIIAPETTSALLEKDMEELTDTLTAHFPDLNFSIGLGSEASSLSELPRSFLHARAAASMAVYRNMDFFAFNNMGFFRILLSVSDRRILESYAEEQLGTIRRYDQAHNSRYLDTLYQYLLYNGSIQKIAEALFCHRNTINYRIRVLKEELGCPLDDVGARFELMAAFQIMEYLNVLEGCS